MRLLRFLWARLLRHFLLRRFCHISSRLGPLSVCGSTLEGAGDVLSLQSKANSSAPDGPTLPTCVVFRLAPVTPSMRSDRSRHAHRQASRADEAEERGAESSRAEQSRGEARSRGEEQWSRERASTARRAFLPAAADLIRCAAVIQVSRVAMAASAAAAAAAPVLSASQLALFHTCAALLADASPHNLDPLTLLHETLIHQTSAHTSYVDRVAVSLALLPEMRVRLASGGGSAAKLRIWLIDFLSATLQMDAKTFTPHVVSMLITMTADEKSDHTHTQRHSRTPRRQCSLVPVLSLSVLEW